MIFPQRWTQSDITDLRARVQMGDSVEKIAEESQRTPDEIRSMIARLRLKPAMA
ncbi:MAG TPA: hypothetical protein VF637_07110 [Sphingomicrobium sp.]|jgi:hypothetical protein